MEISIIIILIITIICILCGFYFLFHIPVARKNENRTTYPKVSVIIPARNEESNISVLLKSIDYYSNLPFEVIVVNDASTDKTKEIAQSLGATVIDSKTLAADWKGKPWACWQGAEYAQGEILVFLDADTMLEPKGLKAILDTFIDESESTEKGIALSIAPYHKVQKLYEEFSALFNIIMLGSMSAFTPSKSKEATGLFGQSLIVSRDNYFAIGGHSAVRDKILENVFMAKFFQEKGIKLRCIGGKAALSFRMYPDGFLALINGWTKAFAAGAGQTPFIPLFLIILWLSAGFIITIEVILAFAGTADLSLWVSLYLVYAAQLLWMLKRIGDFKFISAILFPIHLVFYVVFFMRSLYYQITKKSISWKARDVQN